MYVAHFFITCLIFKHNTSSISTFKSLKVDEINNIGNYLFINILNILK
jgi:hypothetical protein